MGVGCLSLEMSKRHHPDLFLKWAWKMFRGRFIFASGFLPDRDCIFWENVLADERRVEKQGWVLRSRPWLDGVGDPAYGGGLGCKGLGLSTSFPWRSPLSLQGMGPPLRHP